MACAVVCLQAVRASSAAPYYLDDFLTADGKRFQDGATTANNPTIIALQQARLLHPQVGSLSRCCLQTPPHGMDCTLSAAQASVSVRWLQHGLSPPPPLCAQHM